MKPRTCKRCSQEKPLDRFMADSRLASGRSHICQECFRAKRRANYAALMGRPIRGYEYKRRAAEYIAKHQLVLPFGAKHEEHH